MQIIGRAHDHIGRRPDAVVIRRSCDYRSRQRLRRTGCLGEVEKPLAARSCPDRNRAPRSDRSPAWDLPDAPSRVARKLGDAIVKPSGRAVAEVGARRLADGTEHLKHDEDGLGNGERNGWGTAALHRGHRHAHCDGEGCRKQAAEHQYRPPGGGVRDYSEFFGTLLSEPSFRVG